MSMTVNGKFLQSLPIQEGDSQRGHWVRGGFVIEHGEDYPRKAAFSCFGEDKVAQADLPAGTPVQVRFVPESREYNGRWYTELRCLSVAPLAQPAAYTQPAQPTQPTQPDLGFDGYHGRPTPAPYPANLSSQPATAAPQAPVMHADEDLPF